MRLRIVRPLVRAGIVGVLALAGVACSSDEEPAGTTATRVATTTTSTPRSTTTVAPVPTTALPAPTSTTAAATTSTTSTTSTSSTTTTIAPSTTTTEPPGAALVLRENGLGNAAFGAAPDGVIEFVSGYLGKPTVDSGWMDPLSLGSCPGTQVRTVTWGDLNLYFGDESRVVVGRDHFFAYSYGPPFGATVNPAGLKTDGAIGVGSTLGELRATYPAVLVNPAEATAPASFEVSPALTGQLSGDDEAATVTAVLGGFGCGE